MRSWIALLSAGVAVVALAGILIGPLAARFGVLPPIAGFALFALSLLLGGVFALTLGLLGLWRTRKSSGRSGRSNALLGSVVGALLLLTVLALGSRSSGVPPIHDITTSPDRPPTFVELAGHPDNQGRDLTYPHGGQEVIELQRGAYPELAPIALSLPPEEAFAAAKRAVADLQWELAAEDPAARRIEASETTAVFRFVDDVVIEVDPAPAGSTVHVRSTSRVGQSDLGANAARIERFAAALREQ